MPHAKRQRSCHEASIARRLTRDDVAPLYEIDEPRRVLYAVIAGPLRADSAAHIVDELIGDPRFAPDLRGFLNLRFCTGPAPSTEALQDLAIALSPILTLPVRRRCAILVRTTDFEARARMFERLTSGSFVHFRAFTDDSAANAWLGIETGTEPWNRTPNEALQAYRDTESNESIRMSENLEPTPTLPNVFYVAVAELPASFERIQEWVEELLSEHPHLLGIRGLIDCSQLVSKVPPTVEYLERLARVLRPLMVAAHGTKCALLVPSEGLMWRARIFESVTSDSRIHFRAFDDKAAAFQWLARDADASGG